MCGREESPGAGWPGDGVGWRRNNLRGQRQEQQDDECGQQGRQRVVEMGSRTGIVLGLELDFGVTGDVVPADVSMVDASEVKGRLPLTRVQTQVHVQLGLHELHSKESADQQQDRDTGVGSHRAPLYANPETAFNGV